MIRFPKTAAIAACGLALALAGCASGGGYPAYGPGPGGPVAGEYDTYYDGFYGPIDDGYWGPDAGFYYHGSDGRFVRDSGNHFRHENFAGSHGMRSHPMPNNRP